MSVLDGAPLPALVLELLVKSLLLLAVVLSLTWFMRRSSAAVRHLYFTIAALAVIALPLVGVLLPSWHPGVVPERFGFLFAPPPLYSPVQGSSDVVSGSTQGGLESPPNNRTGGAPTAEGRTPHSWHYWFFVVWLSGFAILLAGLAGGKVYGFLTAQRASPVADEDFVRALDDAARRLGLDRDIVVLESDRVKVPCVTGILRPKLLVPPQAVFWPHDRLTAVLRHELSHIRRNDITIQFFAQVACCFYWPNPLVWITERMLFIERERACDDIALGQDLKASDYAGHLMEVLEEMGNSRNTLWVTAAMAEGTDFKDRILSVLNPAAKRTSPRKAHVLAAAAVALLAVLPLSTLRPWAAEATARGYERAAADAAESDADRDSRRSQTTTRREGTRAREDGTEIPLSVWLEQLSSRSAELRERAAVALGESRDRRAVHPLIEALGDKNAGVREHAATALGKLRDNRAVPSLCDLLLNDPHSIVRQHAARSLGDIGDDRAYQPLLQAMQSDSNDVVREHAFSALRRLRGEVRR